MAPPDKPHTYTIHVFALDTALPLERGFYMNELYHAMDGHVPVSYTHLDVYKRQSLSCLRVRSEISSAALATSNTSSKPMRLRPERI